MPAPMVLLAKVAVADVVDRLTVSPATTPDNAADPVTSCAVADVVASYSRLLAVMPVTVKFFAVTVTETVVVSVLYEALVGTNVTDNMCVPTASFVPLAGLYVNCPATDADALSCVDDNKVPYTMFDGFDHVKPAVALRMSADVVGCVNA